MAFKCQTKAQRLEEKVNKEVDKVSKAVLDALNGDRSIRGMTNKAYAEKGIIKSERTLTNWGKDMLKGVNFREVFRALVLAGYEIDITLSKEGITIGTIQSSARKA